MKTIRLRDGKERSLQRRHPWVFEGSITQGHAELGDTVRLESADGRFLGWGAYSPASNIRVRAWSFDEAERIDEAFFERRLRQAIALRDRLAIHSDGVRLVHGEADGLPGLVVDRYGDTLSVQFLAAGAERWQPVIADALLQITGLSRLYERSDVNVRKLEGLAQRTGWLRGEGPTELSITEHGWQLGLDVAQGHKTGYYLDQRDNRQRFAQLVSQLGCRTVLNCYAYTGGFSVAALAGGAAEVTTVDSSAPALERARDNLRRNGFDDAAHHFADADVNAWLRQALADGRQFDAIVLDPPKFAPSAAHAERAARAYKDINRLGLKLLAPGGLLMTYSCSGGVSAELFHKVVASAGLDAGVNASILQRLEGACDHPTTLEFPEGEYLKGLALLRL
ncbi:class I SAM-dependent rRNA methyltransferase [Aquabacterium sp. OR-4]|uniref:class I SAM-dependent rRNA methyltransferase n=1 Tax=Aquabacterium sp. OR-4 TaxID=2978127 RepID=UPI0021B3EEA2|nr:class I SAM-dependent rRNA methyltransferase [Aquabacterium sp. OR-4]MDT7837905.1 class I SAM-dependent rRNA methyltransferase [Aquabacterium sp. OR-4]